MRDPPQQIRIVIADSLPLFLDGLEQLVRSDPELLLTVLVTTEITEDELAAAIGLGAKGVLLKEVRSELVLRCIHYVHAGKDWPEMTPIGMPCAVCALSRRAKEVAALAAAGYRNREIGERLFITDGTVKGHLNRIYEKLGVRHRVGLARAVRECGMLET